MFEFKKGLFVAAVVCSLAFTSAQADSMKNVAKDSRGNFVTSTNGNCVRTRWQEPSDPCAPAPAPQPVVQEKKEVIISPARSLQKEQRTVYFEFDKATLTAESKTKLDSLASVLKSDKEVKQARIVGFADRMGSDAYNEKLSQRRAASVKDYLTSKGYLNASTGETRWLGESAPITNCPAKASKAKGAKKGDRKAEIACLAEDRRVELEIDFLQ